MKIFVLSILIVLSLGCFEQAAAQDAPAKRGVSIKQEAVKPDASPAQEALVKENIDLSDVAIEMKRDGSSLGCVNCADIYKVSINGNGTLVFEGNLGARLNG